METNCFKLHSLKLTDLATTKHVLNEESQHLCLKTRVLKEYQSD